MNNETFAEWWSRLESTLHPGTEVRHWSAHGQYQLGGMFVVTEVRRDDIWITHPTSSILKEDFEAVFPLWEDYRREIKSRQRIDEITIKSTYLISIMNWMETPR